MLAASRGLVHPPAPVRRRSSPGMVFGLVAMGIVLVYRSTRVINFAVANLGFLGAGLFALLVAQYNVPFWLGGGRSASSSGSSTGRSSS